MSKVACRVARPLVQIFRSGHHVKRRRTSHEAGFVYSNEGAKQLNEGTLAVSLLRTLVYFSEERLLKMSEQDGCGTQTALFCLSFSWLVCSHRVKRKERAGGVATSAL